MQSSWNNAFTRKGILTGHFVIVGSLCDMLVSLLHTRDMDIIIKPNKLIPHLHRCVTHFDSTTHNGGIFLRRFVYHDCSINL